MELSGWPRPLPMVDRMTKLCTWQLSVGATGQGGSQQDPVQVASPHALTSCATRWAQRNGLVLRCGLDMVSARGRRIKAFVYWWRILEAKNKSAVTWHAWSSLLGIKGWTSPSHHFRVQSFTMIWDAQKPCSEARSPFSRIYIHTIYFKKKNKKKVK